MKFLVSLLALSAIAFSLTPKPAAAKPWVTAYLPAWEVTQNGVVPAKIDMKSVTHLIWFSLAPTEAGDVVESASNPGMEKYASQVAAAAHRAHKKALIGIGGAGTEPAFAAAFQKNPGALVKNIVVWVAKHGFDGVDIDDEPLQPANSEGYQTFIRSLRKALPKGAVLTAAVEPFGSTAATFGPIAGCFDQINDMTYDMIYGNGLAKGSGQITWYNAPISGGSNLEQTGGAMPTAIRSLSIYQTRVGIPTSKLGLGAAFYGYVFPGATSPMQEYHGSFPPRDISYADIMTTYYQPKFAHFDDACQSAYISRTDTANFITFDDPRAVAAKVRYVKSHGLGGLVCFEIGHQYMGGRNPLLKAIDAAL